MKTLLAIFGLLVGIQLAAQTSLNDLKFNIYQGLNSSVIQNYIRQINELEEGEADKKTFRFNDWQKAEVLSKNGELVNIDSLNYHYNDETMFIMREGRLYFLYPEQINQVVTNGITFIPIKSELDNNHPFKYFEILVDGELQLLKNTQIEKKKINNHPMGVSSGIEKYKEYEKSKLYYKYLGNSDPQEIPKKKKNFIRIFKSNKMKVISFARDYNISPKSEPDVVNIFSFYNSL